MKSRGSALGIFVLVLLLFLTTTTGAFAALEETASEEQAAQWEEQAEDGQLFKNYLLNRDIEFKGPLSSDRTYINVDKHWQVRKAWISLAVTVSDLSKNAALTVYVNNLPINTELLAQSEQSQILRLPLPLTALKEGSNEIRLEVSTTGSENNEAVCMEETESGRWVLIRGTSYVHLNFSENAPTSNLNEYPYPFLKTSESPQAHSSLILLPDQASEEEIAAALRIAAGLGALAQDESTDLNMASYSQVTKSELSKYDIIYLGGYDQAPAEIRSLLSESDKAGLSQGAVIFRGASPFNKEKTLMGITTQGDKSDLVDAARLFQNGDLMSQMDANVYQLRHGMEVGTLAAAAADQYVLKDMGYGNGIYLEGRYRQQATAGIRLTSNRLVVPGAKAVVHFRYAQNLDFDKSLVTIYVNGVPVGSKKLTSENAQEDKLEVPIPENLISAGYVEVSFSFDLLLKNMGCDRLHDETPWAFVDGQTAIYLPSKGERALLLDNYPWPFVKDGRFNDTAVVVSSQPSKQELDFVAELFGFLGKEVKDNEGTLTVVKDSELKELDKRYNYIMAGTPSQLQAIRTINESLWFKYDDQFGYFQSNEMRRLLESFSRNLASVQLAISPVNPERGLLIATAPKQENLLHVKKYLTEPRFASNLLGNAMLVDREENATNHYFAEEEIFSVADRINMGSSQFKVFAVMFATVMLLIFIGIFWYWKNRRRR